MSIWTCFSFPQTEASVHVYKMMPKAGCVSSSPCGCHDDFKINRAFKAGMLKLFIRLQGKTKKYYMNGKEH